MGNQVATFVNNFHLCAERATSIERKKLRWVRTLHVTELHFKDLAVVAREYDWSLGHAIFTPTLPEYIPVTQPIGVQFVKDGPTISVEILQALEAGDLVVFCGAGISRKCGLPDFQGLVTCICDRLGRPMEKDEKEAFEDGKFDATLGLIEHRIGKPRLRVAVRDVLDLAESSDFSTHQALLQLAGSKFRRPRLVTTNFDKAFELSPFSGERTFDYAPYLPLPGNEWSSIVHLHGGLGNERDTTGESLVFTSSDFGRAYITEGWASRFLTELFRRARAVLFVGYSISDPAIRYIVDAFAADRANQDSYVAKAFILAGTTSQDGALQERTWKSRGIEPVIYDSRDNHALLHETIQNCARRFRRGFFDRDSIVIEYGPQSPLKGVGQEAISQVAWALQEGSGHAARRFAELKPQAPLEWLEFLEQAGIFELGMESQLGLSLVGPIRASDFTQPLHATIEGLCKWLCSYLDAPKLVKWAVGKGSHLHPSFAGVVRDHLMTQEGTSLPKGALLLWTFLSSQPSLIYSPITSKSVLFHLQKVKDREWDPILRNLVLSWLAPTIGFSEPMHWARSTEPDPGMVNAYVQVELLPAAGREVSYITNWLLERSDTDVIVQDLLEQFTEILKTGFIYLHFLEQIDRDLDKSYIFRPSIDTHSQNTQLYPWTVYIELLREAWERVAAIDIVRAREEVSRWGRLEFPLFRRFVLWTAGKLGGLSASESIDYLANQPPSALWGLDTHRELLQYLARIAPQLSANDTERLVALILGGPPRSLYRAEASEEQIAEDKERKIYLRLAKLRDGGLALPEDAKGMMSQILDRHSGWDQPISERDEFLFWVGDAHWRATYEFEPQLGDYQDWNNRDIISDIQKDPNDPQVLACWRGFLVRNPHRAITILEALGTEAFFDSGIWALGLERLNGQRTRADCLRLFADFGAQLGAGFLSEHLYPLTHLIRFYTEENNNAQDNAFWSLWDLLIGPAAEIPTGDGTDPVYLALNSPIGNLTDALLRKLGELAPRGYEDIPPQIRGRLEELLKCQRSACRLSRTVLARALWWFHRLKPDLVVPGFLSLFDWGHSDETLGVWSGFLMSPKMTPDLWPLMRPRLLKALPHAEDMGDLKNQLYLFFAFLLLHEDFPLEQSDARRALMEIPPGGRAQVAWYWWRQADSSTDYGATLFRERLKYLLTKVWPLELELRDEASSLRLAEIALCCGTEFEDAVETISVLLIRIAELEVFLFELDQKDLCEKYPNATLRLIDLVIGEKISSLAAQDLRKLLNRITAREPQLIEDPKFVRTDALVRQFE